MPRQIDQLPSDATSLARRLQSLEREVRELRASRRLGSATAGLIRTAASGPRIELNGTDQTFNVYSGESGDVLIAQIGPDTEGAGGFWSRGSQSPFNLSAYLAGGEIAFRTVDNGVIAAPAGILYTTDGTVSADLILTSGSINSGDKQAAIIMETLAGGAAPAIYMTGNASNRVNVDVDGILTAGNLAYGSVSITPSAANTPTSAAVSGLNIQGSTFLGFASPSSAVPGTTVTGTSTTSVSATGLTVWVTRTNTTATTVNWLVIGV